jgi:hypothetical protein
MTKNDDSGKKYLDSEGFVDLIAVCSLEVDLPSLSDKAVNRLVFIVEKMNESEGIEKIVKKTNNMSEYKQSDSCQLLFKFKMFINHTDIFEVQRKVEPKISNDKEFFDLII